MTKIAALLVAALFFFAPSSFAQNQPVYQSGTVTPGHLSCWATSGVIQDCVNSVGLAGLPKVQFLDGSIWGTPGITAGTLNLFQSSVLSPTGPLGTNFCDYDAPSLTVPYHYLCFSANAQGGGLIAYGAGNGATQYPLQFTINGNPVSTFPIVGTSGATVPLNNGGFTQSGTANFTGTLEINGTAVGTSATVNTGTSGATVPLNNGGFTQSGASTFTNTLGISGGLNGTDALMNSSYLFFGPGSVPSSVTGLYNTTYGVGAGGNLTGAASDVLIGYHAGYLNTCGQGTVAIGANVFSSYVDSSGTCSEPENANFVVIGDAAGTNITAGYHGVIIGEDAFTTGTTCNTCMMIGSHAGGDMTSSTNDNFIGASAGVNATTTGGDNNVIGVNAGGYLESSAAGNILIGSNAGAATAGNPNTGSNNVGVGTNSLLLLTSASQTVAIGSNAGQAVTSGNGNVLVGYQAGNAINTGFNNVAVGTDACNNITTGKANICLGAQAGTGLTTVNNQFVAGGDNANWMITDIYFGRGITSTSPQSVTWHGTGGSGSNVGGANLTIAGGIGTGTGVGGKIIFQTALHESSSSTPNTLATVGYFDEAGVLYLPALGTSTSALDYLCWNSSGGAVTGDGSGTCLASLEELKDNLGYMNSEQALWEALQLKPFWGKYKDSVTSVSDHREHAMFGAHQVESVDPRLASYDGNGDLHGVRYMEMSALNNAAIHALNDKIDAQAKQIEKLSALVQKLLGQPTQTIH